MRRASGRATTTEVDTARPWRWVRITSSRGGTLSPAAASIAAAGVLASPGHDVEHGVGDEEVAIAVDRRGERPEAGQLGGGQPERRGVARQGRKDRLPVADTAPGVLDADRVLGAEPLDRRPVADHPLDGATERLGQVRAEAHLPGELVDQPDAVRVEVHVPAPGLGIGHGPVAQDCRSEGLGLGRGVQVLRREGATGHRRPRGVDPAVRAELEVAATGGRAAGATRAR